MWHHDRSLKRVCGADVSIGDLTYKELQQYRLQNTEERVPLFSDVLALVDGRTPLIIELKHYDDADLLCPLVWELLRNYKGPYCVESFDPYIVRWFRKNHPYVLRGQLMGHFEGKDEECKGFFRALFWRNLWTNVLTRPHFEAYERAFQEQHQPPHCLRQNEDAGSELDAAHGRGVQSMQKRRRPVHF